MTRHLLLIALAALVATSSVACADVDDDDGEDTAESTDALDAASMRIETVFSTPLGDGKDDPTLENAMVDLIGKATSGSKIRVAIFHFTRVRVAQALVAAAKKGADVRVVLDESNRTDDGKDLNAAVKLLRDSLPKGSVTLCRRGACIGDGINHNKFLLFSALSDGSRNVVVQSSANLTNVQLGLHNNAVIVRNDRKLFQGYAAYFRDLEEQKLDLGYARTIEGTKDRVRTYVFPRDKADTVVELLDNVRCREGATVRVAMAFFTDARSAVATQLVRMAGKKCDVRVAMPEPGDNVDASIVKQLRSGGVGVFLYPKGTGNSIHSKYILVDAPYASGGQVSPRRLVFTGSHNLTGPALRRNDETLMRVDDAATFAAFSTNWKTIRQQTR